MARNSKKAASLICRYRDAPLRLRRLLFALAAALSVFIAACGDDDESSPGAVHILTTDGVVNPVMARYIDRGLDSAEDNAAAAVVLRLDTPGGLLNSMNDIVERILEAEVPVIVYISPAGAHAASAGTFITMAAHVAAMADATRIGAATPIDASGEDIEGDLGSKVTNDAVAQITGLAQKRGRNAEWAEKAVREAAAANEREALSLNVVDLVAPDLRTLLDTVDGRQVELPAGMTTLRTKDAPLVFRDMNLLENTLDFISDPNLAFILLNIAIIAILIELYNPGLIVPGVTGVVALAIALFAFGTLPVNWLGVGFIILAFVLFGLEPFITSHGTLSIGGLAFLIAGSLILTGGNSPEFRVSPWLMWSFISVIAAFIVLFAGVLLRARRYQPVAMGTQRMETLVGRTAVVRAPLNPVGTVYLGGEEWSAIAVDGPVQEGETVIVTAVEGLRLRVARPKTEL